MIFGLKIPEYFSRVPKKRLLVKTVVIVFVFLLGTLYGYIRYTTEINNYKNNFYREWSTAVPNLNATPTKTIKNEDAKKYKNYKILSLKDGVIKEIASRTAYLGQDQIIRDKILLSEDASSYIFAKKSSLHIVSINNKDIVEISLPKNYGEINDLDLANDNIVYVSTVDWDNSMSYVLKLDPGTKKFGEIYSKKDIDMFSGLSYMTTIGDKIYLTYGGGDGCGGGGVIFTPQGDKENEIVEFGSGCSSRDHFWGVINNSLVMTTTWSNTASVIPFTDSFASVYLLNPQTLEKTTIASRNTTGNILSVEVDSDENRIIIISLAGTYIYSLQNNTLSELGYANFSDRLISADGNNFLYYNADINEGSVGLHLFNFNSLTDSLDVIYCDKCYSGQYQIQFLKRVGDTSYYYNYDW